MYGDATFPMSFIESVINILLESKNYLTKFISFLLKKGDLNNQPSSIERNFQFLAGKSTTGLP